jgi:hypothetical protein
MSGVFKLWSEWLEYRHENYAPTTEYTEVDSIVLLVKDCLLTSL